MNAMKLNLDEIYERLEPWELVLTIGGAERRVRRLTNVDLELLRRFGQMKLEESVPFVAGLFEGEQPDVRQWDDARVTLLLTSVLAYYADLVKKKAAGAAAAVAKQMGSQPAASPDGGNRS
jgi:hypothetical protein